MAQPWSSGLFGCFDDIGICCYGLFCTPCLYGENVNKLNGVGCYMPCCQYYCLAGLSMCCCVASPNRTMIRNKYGLAEEPCNDCCVHVFFSPCAVCQEARELKKQVAAPPS